MVIVMNKKKKIGLAILTILISIVVFFTLYLYHVMVYLMPEPPENADYE